MMASATIAYAYIFAILFDNEKFVHGKNFAHAKPQPERKK